MRTARPTLRLVAAILRIVAFVVMVPAFAQAHAGHGATGAMESGHARSVGHTRSVAAPAGVVAADAATDRADRADCVGCQGCCCAHVFVAVSDNEAVLADRLGGRRVAMGPDTARPSAVAEALPEPPRPFA